MAREPINIFSRLTDVAGVARFIRERSAGVIVGTDEDWRDISVSFHTGTLTFKHSAEYCSEPNWSRQMEGMRGYFARFPDSPRKEKVLLLTTTFKLSLATVFDPDFTRADDPRLELLFAVARFLDGVLFTPSSLRDANGRILFGTGAEGEDDPEAEWPKVLGEVSLSTPLGAAMHELSRPKPPDEEPGEDTNPPSAERVARRALALVAVTGRAILEQDDSNAEHVQNTYADLLAWVKGIGIDDEFEPTEREVVNCPLGQLDKQQQANATWRLEALAVLAWALKRFEVPPHDELVKLNPLWTSLCILDVEAARALIANPELRAREEIGTLRNRMFALHWRLRNFHITPTVMDFAAFAQTCAFGPLDITGLPLIEGDLAISGVRLDRADKSAFATARSTAHERHQAVNWLWEGPEDLSAASVAT